jgi:hypothetical protein
MPTKPKSIVSSDPIVLDMRHSLAQRIHAITAKPGEHATAIPELFLYHRTTPTPATGRHMSPVSASLFRDESASYSAAPSTRAMPRRFCFPQSTCLLRARSWRLLTRRRSW